MSQERRPGDVSERVAARQLKTLIKKYNRICQYCFKTIPPGMATREHIKRLVDGGTSDMDNLTLACKPCNQNQSNVLEDIKRITESIQECIERQAKGLPSIGKPKISSRDRIADTWPVLISKGIAGTIRRNQLGLNIPASPPAGVECSSLRTKKEREC